MGESREDISYMWTNYYDEANQLLEMNLDFFLKLDPEEVEGDYLEEGLQDDDNLYERYREVHLQRAHREEEIVDVLKKAGFGRIDSYGDFSFDRPGDQSERIFFTAIKQV